jgi:PAS domain S-box-containing protein
MAEYSELDQMSEQLRAIHDDLPVGIFVTEISSLQFLHVNASLCRMLGYTREELLAKTNLDIHPPEERSRIMANRQQSEKDRTRSFHGESIACVRKDGSLVYGDLVLNQATFFQRPCVIGYFWEVTRQKRSADFLRMERDLGLALSAVNNLDEALLAVLDTVCQIDGIDCAGIYLAEESSGDFKLCAHKGVTQSFAERAASHKADSLHARAIRAGRAIYNRVNPDANEDENALHQLGLRSVVLLPVLYQEQAMGSLNVASRTLDDIPRDISHALEAIANLLGSVVLRLKAQQSHFESEEKFNTFINRSPYGYAEIDLEGRISFANQRIANIFGYSPEETKGTSFTQYLDVQEASRAQEALDLLRQGALRPGPTEYLCRAKDGAPLYLEISSVPLVKGGKVVAFQCVMLDVTIRRRALDALEEQVQRTQKILDISMDGFLVIGMDGRILEANPAFCSISGLSQEELLGKTVAEIGSQDTPERMRDNRRQTLQSGHSRFLTKHLRKDGRMLDMEVSLHHCRFGKKEFLFCFCRDVTERIRAEMAIRDQETKLRSLLENLPDMIVVLDEQGVVRYANHGMPQVPLDIFVGSLSFDFVNFNDEIVCRQFLERAFADEKVQSMEVLDIFGTWWAIRLVPMTDAAGTRTAIVICTDVTQQKKAAEAVAKEQLLLHQLLELHERDRQLIAYEIHDGLTQHLTGALMNFDAYLGTRETDPQKAQNTFSLAHKLLAQSVGEARRLISGLRPPILDELGIVDAVDYLVNECRQQRDVEIDFRHDLSASRLAPPLENAVFRIVQESLNNACRHSRSDVIIVELKQRGDRLQVDVRDDGVGFEPNGVQKGCFGLQGIRERARLLGGRADIITAPNRGTHISVELPFLAKAQDAVEESEDE